MSLEAIKSALEKLDGGSDIYEQIVNVVETEKQTGINAKNKVNKEAKALREQLSEMKPFKEAVTNTLQFDPTAGTDLNDFLEGLKGDSGKGSDVLELEKKLQRQNKTLEKMQSDLAEKEKIANQLKQRQTTDFLKNQLTGALKNDDGSYKLYGADLLVDSLITNGKVKLEEDEKTVIFIDGDDTIDFDNGIKKVIESRQDLHRNQQRPGGGSRTGDPGATNMTDDQKRLEHLRKSARF